MNRARTAATALVVTGGLAVATLGATWAADDAPPRLVQDAAGPLFDDVPLSVGQPVTRCRTIRPERGALTALDFDGAASGSLAGAVRIRVDRGLGSPADPTGCASFVPVVAVYDGPLDQLPPATSRLTNPVALADGTAIAYRATLELTEPSVGSTAINLRVTGVFADRPAPRQGPQAPDAPRTPQAPGAPDTPQTPSIAVPPNVTTPDRCRQYQTTGRTVRTDRRGPSAMRVSTPRSLQVTPIRPLPVYVGVTTGTHRTLRPAPLLRVGATPIPLRRTRGGRWRGLVPLRLLVTFRTLEVRSAGLRVRVPIVTGPCRARLRVFARADGRFDLRIDAQQPISGARLRLPATLAPIRDGRLLVRYADAAGRARTADRRRRRSSRG